MLLPIGRILVPVPGTLVRATSLEGDPAARYSCHGVMVQTIAGNTGRTYVGIATMNKTTLAGVLAQLAIPTANFIPTFSAALTISPSAILLHDLWIDADIANDGVIISVLIT